MTKNIKTILFAAAFIATSFMCLNMAKGSASASPTVATDFVSYITTISANLNGRLLDAGDAPSTEMWFEYWRRDSSGSRKETDRKSIFTPYETGRFNSGYAFNAPALGLESGKEYCFRAVARNSVGTSYGAEKCFTVAYTDKIASPIIKTLNPTNVSGNRATLNGRVENLMNPVIARVHFEWYDQQYPHRKYQTPQRTVYLVSDISEEISDLLADKFYCYKIVAQANSYNADACAGQDCGSGLYTYSVFGQEKCFTTGSGSNDNDNHDDIYRPTISDFYASNIGDTSATLNLNISSLGNDSNAYVWFEYGHNSTGENHTPETSRTSTGNYSYSISGLQQNTTYRFIAYARNSDGTTATSEKTFTTSQNQQNQDAPEVSTRSAINIGDYDADLQGRLDDIGNDNDAQVWFEYGKTTSYGYTTSQRTKNSTGDFTENISNLSSDTAYHFRAVARNQYGTRYGSDYTFRTDYNGNNNDNNDRPDVATRDASNITRYEAELEGELMDIGDDDSAQVWFEYGRTTSYGYETSRRVKYSEGSFYSDISGLESYTTYHFRAVAQNDRGTTYGEDRTFFTDNNGNNNDNNNYDRPSVSTRPATNVSRYEATLNGYLDDTGDGGDTQVWFEYGSNEYYGYRTAARTKSSVGSFSADVSNLYANKTYHFRAVARNNHGTTYSSDRTFYTSDSYSDRDDNYYDDNYYYDDNRYNTGLYLKIWDANISYGQRTWSKSVSAQPNNIISFIVEAKNNTNFTMRDVLVDVALASRIKLYDGIYVNGNRISDRGLSAISLGNLSPGQRKTIMFQGRVDSNASFGYGANELITIASVRNAYAVSDSAKVIVSRTGLLGISTGPTSLSTGLADGMADFFLIPALLALLSAFFFRKQLGLAFCKFDDLQIKAQSASSERELLGKINRIRLGNK